MRRKKRSAPEVNASSMADIAFLLLIFFIITSNALTDSGTRLVLPVKTVPQPVQIEEQNICSIIMNSQDQFLVNGKIMTLDQVPVFVEKFITNNGVDPTMSENPDNAIVVLKTSRGSSYDNYAKIINKVQMVYFDLWSKSAGISTETLLSWDVDQNEKLSLQLDKLRENLPYNFVIAEQEL